MPEEFQKHLNENNFDKYYKKLIKKLKNKKVIIYGAGNFFQYIQSNYDLSALNIIGISDGKYSLNQEGQEDLGYKIIPKEKITEYNPDVVLIGTINYLTILEQFVFDILKDTKIKAFPLVKISFWKLLKQIWAS